MVALERLLKSKVSKKVLVILAVIFAVLIVIGLVLANYIHGLIGLVETGEVEGDPNYHETNVDETSEGNNQTNESNDPDGTGPSAEPNETVTETTIDPRIIEIQEQQREAGSIAVRSDSKVYNILLIGSDRRLGETTGRSDSMIILSINRRTGKIHLVSLMRALYVKIPEHGFGMLNSSFAYGGSKMLRQTIENNLRVHIDDYVMIDFSGFIAAIDSVGGIDIQLTLAEANELNLEFSTPLVEGTNHLNGTQALAYSRIRHIDSDFARTGRQRYVIETLIQKAMTLSLTDLDAMARAILPLVKTNLDANEMIGLALGVLDYRGYSIRQLMLPIKNSYEIMYVNGMEVVKFDYRDNILALQDFLYDD